LIFACKVSAD